MKTNIFNFNRIGLLFQRYFIGRFRTELIYWSIMAIAFMFIRNNLEATFAMVGIAGLFYAARFFKEIHSPRDGIAYFMIPATQVEKLTVAILTTTLYYFAMMAIAYVVGNLAGTYLNNMLANIDYFHGTFGLRHSSLQWKLFESAGEDLPSVFGIKNISWIVFLFTNLLISQALFLLGGIYFKKNQAFKTFLVTVLFCLLIVIVVRIDIKLILNDWKDINTNTAPIEGIMLWRKIVINTGEISYFLLPPFFWVVSYFRLTEKEV